MNPRATILIPIVAAFLCGGLVAAFGVGDAQNPVHSENASQEQLRPSEPQADSSARAVRADRLANSVHTYYEAHYACQGPGLILYDDDAHTIWAYISFASPDGAARYRVLALPLEDEERPAADPAVARGMPARGVVTVEAVPAHEAVRVSVKGTRLAFVAALNDRTIRPRARTSNIDVQSIGSATLTETALDSLFQRRLGFGFDVAGASWAAVLHASGAYSTGSDGERAQPPCCQSGVECIAGGEGSATCSHGEGGQSVSVQCDEGYYACCCNIGPQGEIELRANCCKD